MCRYYKVLPKNFFLLFLFLFFKHHLRPLSKSACIGISLDLSFVNIDSFSLELWCLTHGDLRLAVISLVTNISGICNHAFTHEQHPKVLVWFWLFEAWLILHVTNSGNGACSPTSLEYILKHIPTNLLEDERHEKLHLAMVWFHPAYEVWR